MSSVVVFGAGQVGGGLAATLVGQGHSVRVARRSPSTVAGAEVVTGDARDPAFAARVSKGADTVYHCMNPSSYSGRVWEAEFPLLGEALIGAAVANDAKLVCLDNLYGYGITDRRTESSPLAATGRKGRVRVAWDARLRAEPGLRYAVGRAGDFWGPGTSDQSLFSPSAVAGLARGSAPWLLGDPSVPHAFSYVPDVIAGLAALGADADAVGVFHLPVAEIAPAELMAALAEALGSSTRARVLPGWAFAAVSPFVPLLRELRETMYQWDRPFLVDDTRFRTRFPGLATALDDAIAATAAEVRSQTRAAA